MQMSEILETINKAYRKHKLAMSISNEDIDYLIEQAEQAEKANAEKEVIYKDFIKTEEQNKRYKELLGIIHDDMIITENKNTELFKWVEKALEDYQRGGSDDR